nr:putative metal-binding motif-containing protein [Thermoflexibacter sp.]
NNQDCNDNNAAINPNAVEVNDGVDNDCDGDIDESTVYFRVYENPSTDGRFYVDYTNPGDTQLQLIVVVQATGQVVYQGNIFLDNTGSVRGFFVDGTSLASGSYLFRVISTPTNQSLSFKVIKL